MARIRTLKPEILEDERTAELSDQAFRLFVSMICLADDYGNLRADERWLRGRVWWAQSKHPSVPDVLAELAGADLVPAYSVREQMYVHLRGWEKHQRIDNRGKAHVPAPNNPEAEPITIAPTVSRKSAAKFRETPLDPDPDMEQGQGPSGKPDMVSLFAEAAVTEINSIARTKYRADSDETLKNSRALVQADHTVDDARLVIRSKQSWLKDDRMRGQFKPSVLLRPSNFKRYLEDVLAGSPVAPTSQPVLRLAAPANDDPDFSTGLAAVMGIKPKAAG